MKLSPEVKMPQFKVQDVIAEECDDAAVLGEISYILRILDQLVDISQPC